VSAAQATLLINREDAVVLDVRDPGEYGAGHILGAKNVPLARIVYCETGNRSAKAAAALKAKGYERVLNLSGGIGAWLQAGLPVERRS
jgi:rhodanese-related sulfurtransferase